MARLIPARLTLVALLASGLLLAACGAQPGPTATPRPPLSVPDAALYSGTLRPSGDPANDGQPYLVLRERAVTKAGQLGDAAPPDHQTVSFRVILYAPAKLPVGALRLYLVDGAQRHAVAASAPLGLTPDLSISKLTAAETTGWVTFVVPGDLHAGQLLMILDDGTQATLEVSW